MKTYRFSEFTPEMLAVAEYQRRDAVADILKFLGKHPSNTVCGVIGLRRTGKTTMLLQAMMDLPDKEREKSLYVRVRRENDMFEVERLLIQQKQFGIKNFFIDEITNLEDFEEKAALFSDDYSDCNFVLSGTDSLLLGMSSDDTLFDRMYEIKTTWISWREYSRVLGKDFQTYVEHAGIMGRNDKSIESYIETSIIDNLVNSLNNAKNGRFRYPLNELLSSGKIRDVVMRVLNDNTHRFITEVLNKISLRFPEFQTATHFASSKSKNFDTKIINMILGYLKKKLGYLEPDGIEGSDPKITRIRQWFQKMDVFIKHPIYPNNNEEQTEYLLSQPALRWHQVLKVIDALLKEPMFLEAFEKKQESIKRILTNAIKGELVEDITLLDTMTTLNTIYEVFSWRFYTDKFSKSGEFDMVICEKEKESKKCSIFEIKNLDYYNWSQAQHLRYDPYLKFFEKYIAEPEFRVVLYNGQEFMDFDDVMWINLPEFLKNLPEYNDYMIKKVQMLFEKRTAYDAYMGFWIKEQIPDLESRMLEYLSVNTKRDIPFASWLNIKFPEPFNEYSEMSTINEISWSALQSVLFDIKNGLVKWDQKVETIFEIASTYEKHKKFEDSSQTFKFY